MSERRTDLLRLVTEYQPVDADEQQYRLEMLDLAAAAHDPFDRFHYAPGHFTASGFTIHPDGGRVLLVHHAKLDRWLQPGGHIDQSDPSPRAAAAREISEETGVTDLTPVIGGLVDVDIHVFPGHGDQPMHRHFDLRYGFVAAAPDIGSNHEVFDVRWVTPDDLEALQVDRSVLRPVAKLLGPENLAP